MLVLIGDFSSVVVAIVLSILSGTWLTYLLTVILIGSRMRALNNLVHEASHNALFRSRKLNLWIGRLCALPIFLSMTDYKTSHMLHHARLGCDGDPDLIRERQLMADKPANQRNWLLCLVNLPGKYVTYVVGSLYLGPTHLQSLAIRLLLIAVLVGLGTLFFGNAALLNCLKYWVVPFFTSYQLIKFIAEAGEHSGLYSEALASEPLAVKSVEMSRNMIPSLPLKLLFYPHGDGYHMLHHRFPAVPGLNLAKLHAHLCVTGWYEKQGFKNNCTRFFGKRQLLDQIFFNRSTGVST